MKKFILITIFCVMSFIGFSNGHGHYYRPVHYIHYNYSPVPGSYFIRYSYPYHFYYSRKRYPVRYW